MRITAWVAAAATGVVTALAVPGLASAAPTATLTTTSGPPTTTLTVTGAGFDPSTQVDVFFDTGDLATAVSSTTGAVSFAITIPQSAQPGSHWITLSEGPTHPAAQVRFSVVTNWLFAGFGPQARRYNAYENTISPSNARSLTRAWSVPLGLPLGGTPDIQVVKYASR